MEWNRLRKRLDNVQTEKAAKRSIEAEPSSSLSGYKFTGLPFEDAVDLVKGSDELSPGPSK